MQIIWHAPNIFVCFFRENTTKNPQTLLKVTNLPPNFFVWHEKPPTLQIVTHLPPLKAFSSYFFYFSFFLFYIKKKLFITKAHQPPP